MKLQHIKLLADENISPKVVAYLRQHDFDVLDVKEQNWQGTIDKRLLNIAHAEQRFVLTHDSDFGTLAINQGQACYGIFYLRLKNLRPDNVIRVCEAVFKQDLELSVGSILVIEESRIRIRHVD